MRTFATPTRSRSTTRAPVPRRRWSVGTHGAMAQRAKVRHILYGSRIQAQPDLEAPEAEREVTGAGAIEREIAARSNQSQRTGSRPGGEVVHSSASSPDEEPLLRERGEIPSNSVTCVRKWQYCRAPYNPGTWAARVTYHCPILLLPWGIIIPGTTQPAFVTIPDEYIGTSSTGRDQYRCRPRSSVVFWTGVADAAATGLTRSQLFPNQAACHAGFRSNLRLALEAVFTPSGGGRLAGIRVNQSPPGGGGRPFPCP